MSAQQIDPVSHGEKVLNIQANKRAFCLGRNRKRINDRLREIKNEWKRYWQEISLNTHTRMLPWQAQTGSLHLCQVHKHIHSPIPGSEKLYCTYLTADLRLSESPTSWKVLCLLTILQNPEQHALRNDSTQASSEGDDLKILMMFDHLCTVLSYLSSQLPSVVCTQVYLEPWSCWLPQIWRAQADDLQRASRVKQAVRKNGHFLLQNNRRKTRQMGWTGCEKQEMGEIEIWECCGSTTSNLKVRKHLLMFNEFSQ